MVRADDDVVGSVDVVGDDVADVDDVIGVVVVVVGGGVVVVVVAAVEEDLLDMS